MKKYQLILTADEIEAINVSASAHLAGDPDGEPFFGDEAMHDALESAKNKATSKERKLPPVHLNYGERAFCGAGENVRLSNVERRVTCERCNHRFGLQDA